MTPMKGLRTVPAWSLVAIGILISFTVMAARAATPFDALLGTWSGSGQIRYEDSPSESIRCTAYYSESNQRLRLAIRCRSASNQIEIRGLLAQRGDRITGTWEERAFNVSGEAVGRMSGGRMALSITGGVFSGSMTVSYGGRRQVVTIAIQGLSIKSVNVTLVRS